MKKIILLVVLSCLALGVWLAIHSARDSRRLSRSGAANSPATNGLATGVAPSNTALEPPGLAKSATPARPQETGTGKEGFGLGVQEIIAKDIAEGINGEARAKEGRLRGLAERLHAGFTLDQTLQVLGEPDAVQMVQVEGRSATIGRTNSFKAIPLGVGMCLSYWPRVDVPFDGRNGQGYEVIFLVFDNEHRLDRWFWETPRIIMSGSLFGKVMQEQEEYWYGKHAISGPPPDGFSAADGFWGNGGTIAR